MEYKLKDHQIYFNSKIGFQRLIINKTDVKNINQQYRSKNRKELIIERLLDFNKVTIELIDPNKLLSPTIYKEKNIK